MRKDGTEAREDAIREAYRDGRGRVMMRACTHIEESARGGRQQIIVTELPYMTNKASLIERIADLARSKRIDGISDLRDESDRHGMRIVIELSRAGQAQEVLNQLYRFTGMQSSFPINMLALVDGQPRTLSLKRMLEHYITFRREVIRRRSQFELDKAREREHILQGLMKALQNLDEVIQTIRKAQSAEEAKERLMKAPFDMSDRQAQAVLDMQLRRLARLERQKIEEEYNGDHPADRLPRRPARQPAQDRLPHQRGRAGHQEEVRRPPPHAHHRPGARGADGRRTWCRTRRSSSR